MYEIFPSFIIMASRGSGTFFTSLVTKTFDVCLLQTMQWPSSLTLLELLEWWASPTEVGRDKNLAMDVCERQIVRECESVCVLHDIHQSFTSVEYQSLISILFFAVVPGHVISNFRRTLTTCFPVWTKLVETLPNSTQLWTFACLLAVAVSDEPGTLSSSLQQTSCLPMPVPHPQPHFFALAVVNCGYFEKTLHCLPTNV